MLVKYVTADGLQCYRDDFGIEQVKHPPHRFMRPVMPRMAATAFLSDTLPPPDVPRYTTRMYEFETIEHDEYYPYPIPVYREVPNG